MLQGDKFNMIVEAYTVTIAIKSRIHIREEWVIKRKCGKKFMLRIDKIPHGIMEIR